MTRGRSNPSRKQIENGWRKLALASGGNGKKPPTLALAPGAKPPWSLTREFNGASKKPVAAADNPARKKQVSELRRQMQQAARKRRELHPKPSRPITSKQTIEKLQRQLSQPKNTWELTPLGTVARSINPERDRRLVNEIRRMQGEMKRAEGKAMKAFNGAAGVTVNSIGRRR